MEYRTEICRDILYDFLDRWTFERVSEMTLDQYVSVGNKDTFCQWLETRTKELGSIKGINSSKFGIYKRRDKSQKPKSLCNDNDYSWQKFYSEDDCNEAFKKIKNEIVQIIGFAENGQFENIDNLHLTKFVKWKIAYLYSNERLIPIFKKEVLVKIAKHFGLEANNKSRISIIQELMITNKPAHLSIYEYSAELYDKFGGNNKKNSPKRKIITQRKEATAKRIGIQTRQGTKTYIATQKHNILQEALKKNLVTKYGKENVLLEKNFVDIKVIQPKKIYFYEVKSSAYPGDCIREALGQILSYTHRDDDRRPKQLIVAGQYKANDDEVEFIKYLKKNLKLDFDYENIDLE